MNVKLSFKPSDFQSFRDFEKAMQQQLGKDVYVGTDSCCVYFQYPKELIAMLRPYPQTVQLEFELHSSKP